MQQRRFGWEEISCLEKCPHFRVVIVILSAILKTLFFSSATKIYNNMR